MLTAIAPSRARLLALALIAANALLGLALGQLLTIAPDMADHWMWAQDLRWGYYEHPPMIALLIRSFALLSADPIWALKLGTVLATAAVILAACYLQAYIFGWSAALLLAIFLVLTPYFALLSIFAHIQPLLLFWLAGLACAWAYARSLNPNWLLLFGVVAGLGGLSKYVYALLYLSGIIWLLLRPRLRVAFHSWQLWCAPLISLLVFSPNLYWNANNEWASIGFHLSRGITNSTSGGWERLLGFSAGHLLLFNLALSLGLWWLALRPKPQLHTSKGQDSAAHSDFRALLLLTALVPIALFSAAALMGSHSDPLWSETAYLGLMMFVAARVESSWRPRWLVICALGQVLVMSLILSHVRWGVFPTESVKDHSLDLYAWDLTGEQLDSILQAADIEPLPKLVITREYQLGGSLSLYLQQHPFPYTLEKPLRNQWGARDELDAQEHVLMFCRARYCAESQEVARQKLGWDFRLLGTARTEIAGRTLRIINVYQALR